VIHGVCPYLEPKVGIAQKKRPRGFALREKSGENGFLREFCYLKLLFSDRKANFVEALYRLVQQTIPTFGSKYGQTLQ
jgi:hypothetical protein